MNKPVIGILGAGKVGIVLAQLAVEAGYDVLIAGSGPVEKIALPVSILAPGTRAVTKDVAAREADIVILAIPLSKYLSLPVEALQGKLVIDSMNHWLEADGYRHDILPDGESSSEFIQRFLSGSRVVKALSHLGYHELHDWHRAAGSPDRRAIAIAGDAPLDVSEVADFINNIGFDPLVIGSLKQGVVLEPTHPGFAANLTKPELAALLNVTQ